ncbi:hypothetical protein [Falsiroseomonas ponticola]|uniref:hypothetical protein n=1 Tax=Falsiroseomonas ponticola TaxID=2786951 RepID=UPI001932B6FC|nr:hypothetical protein [Roseomonas ponticola]
MSDGMEDAMIDSAIDANVDAPTAETALATPLGAPATQPLDVLGLRDARAADPEGSRIELEVNFRSLGWVAFTATASDTLPHARDVWTRLAAGEADAVMPYEAPLAPPLPVPTTVSFRQLILGLLGSGFLTAEQALAAAETRARPAQLEAIVATLPDDAALAARITWATMSEARRSDPLVTALITAGHATAAQVDELFRRAAGL